MCCVQSASLVLGHYVIYGAVMLCVMSWHCTYSGHMTFCYKRSASTLFWALFALISSWFVHQAHDWSPANGWCLTCVGCDASSTSPCWSLLPSSIIIVLALVNSALSCRGLRYLNETWECCPTPCQYRFHRTSVPFDWCLCASW